MAFLDIDDTDIPVWDQGAEETIETIGERVRAFDGTLLSSVIAEKSSWTFETPFLVVSEINAIKALFAFGRTCIVNGEAVGGDDVDLPCKGTVNSVQYHNDAPDFKQSIRFTLQQV